MKKNTLTYEYPLYMGCDASADGWPDAPRYVYGQGRTKREAELHAEYLKAEWLWQAELKRWAKQ